MPASPILFLLLVLSATFVAPRAAHADPPRDLDGYVLLAEDMLFLGANGVVESGHVGVNQAPGVFAKIGEHTLLEDGSVLAGSRVLLDAASNVGDVFANDLSTQPTSTIRGTVEPFGATPLLALDPLPAFAPSKVKIDVPSGGSLVLQPGSYGRVQVRKSATLVLAGGLYDVDDLKVLDDASVRAAGPVELRVRRRMRFNSRVFVGPMPGTGLGAGDVRILTAARTIRVGQSFTMIGHLFAPVGWFNSRNALTVSGQLVARRIQLHPGATLRLVTEVAPPPTPGATPTPTPGATATPTPGATASPGATPTPTPGTTASPGATPTPTPGATPTPTPGTTASPGATPTPTPGATPTPTPGTTASPGATPTPGTTPTPTPSPTPPPTHTPGPTPTPGGVTPTPTASPGTCGDGMVDRPGEECDDGNLTNGDGCSSTCHVEIGLVCTFTPGGWGAKCAGQNVGCRRDAGFATAFPDGLVIGDPAGLDGPANGFAARWSSAGAVKDYLPAGGKAGRLVADLSDAKSTPAGVLGGHLVAAKLNVAIAGTPGDLHLLGCVHPALRDLTIDELIALADEAVATGSVPAGIGLSDLTQALDAVNNNFDDCKRNLGCLGRD